MVSLSKFKSTKEIMWLLWFCTDTICDTFAPISRPIRWKKNWLKVAWLFPRLTLATLYTYSIQDLIGLFNHLRIVIGWSNFNVVQLKILFLKTEHSKRAFNFYYINVWPNNMQSNNLALSNVTGQWLEFHTQVRLVRMD